jgi:hypothetical protein
MSPVNSLAMSNNLNCKSLFCRLGSDPTMWGILISCVCCFCLLCVYVCVLVYQECQAQLHNLGSGVITNMRCISILDEAELICKVANFFGLRATLTEHNFCFVSTLCTNARISWTLQPDRIRMVDRNRLLLERSLWMFLCCLYQFVHARHTSLRLMRGMHFVSQRDSGKLVLSYTPYLFFRLSPILVDIFFKGLILSDHDHTKYFND